MMSDTRSVPPPAVSEQLVQIGTSTRASFQPSSMNIGAFTPMQFAQNDPSGAGRFPADFRALGRDRLARLIARTPP